MALSALIRGENAGTMTSGQRRASAATANRRVYQLVHEKLINISDDSTPVVNILERMGNTKTVGQATYNHWDTDDDPGAVQVDGSTYGTGVTTINLISGHGDRLRVGQVLKAIVANTLLRVTAISSDAITVTRPAFGSTDASIAASAELQIIGFADTDGNTAPRSVTSEPTERTNYCQIMKSAVELSGRDIAQDVYGEDEQTRLLANAKKACDLMREKTFLFQNGISSSDPFATGGIPYWVTTNVTAAGGTLTESTWNAWLKTLARFNQSGDGNMLVLMGELPLDALDGFARDQVRTTPTTEFYGVKVKEYGNAHIDVKWKKHGLFSAHGSGVGSTTGWQGMAYGLNMSKLKIVYFKNRGWRVEPNIETPGTDGKKWQMMVDNGLWIAAERKHALLTGVTG